MNHLTPISQSTALLPHHPFAINLDELPSSDRVRITTAWEKLADKTQRAYYAAHQQCGDWLLQRGVPSLDMLTDELLSLYIRDLAANGIAPASISLAVSAIRWFFRKVRQEPRVWDTTEDRLAIIRKEGAARGVGQVKGLEWQDVQRICVVAEADGTIAGLRDSAMIQLMSDCLLRVSEVVAVNVGDIGNVLTIRQSKTDQEGRSHVISIGAPTLTTINEYRTRAEIHRGALFRRIRRGDTVTTKRLTPDSVRRIIKRWASEARIPEARYSGHSLRVGSAVSLAQAGAGIPEMQQVGRWKSKDMPAYYARGIEAEKDAMARYKYGKRS